MASHMTSYVKPKEMEGDEERRTNETEMGAQGWNAKLRNARNKNKDDTEARARE